MRILFINPVGFLGGAERVLLDVIASLVPVLPPGSSMQLICLADGPLIEAARALGIETNVLPMPIQLTSLGESGLRSGGRVGLAVMATKLAIAAPAAVRYVRQFRQAVAAAQADVIHSNGLKSHLLTRLLPASAGRVLWHVHDFLGGRRSLSHVLRYAAGHVSGAIAVSQAVAVDLKNVLPKTPVITILNGIDTQEFSPGDQDGSMLDRLAGLTAAPAGTVRVGLVATYARWKGQNVFLEAIARLPEMSVPVRFYIVGGSIYHTAGSQFSREELRSMAMSLGLAERIGFVDFQQQTAPIYRALDIMVHASSKPEPFGRTIVEAMACGRAVIISRGGGAAELFTEDVDGIGVRPGKVEDLAAAMARLIDDAPHRTAMGSAARHTAAQRFSRARLGEEFLRVYQLQTPREPCSP